MWKHDLNPYEGVNWQGTWISLVVGQELGSWEVMGSNLVLKEMDFIYIFVLLGDGKSEKL